MTIEDEARAQQMKSWEVTGEAWDAFNAEEFMTNGIQAVYDAGVRAGASRQPSEAEVEAAARAAFGYARANSALQLDGGMSFDAVGAEVRAYWLGEARSALEAARTARGEQS